MRHAYNSCSWKWRQEAQKLKVILGYMSSLNQPEIQETLTRKKEIKVILRGCFIYNFHLECERIVTKSEHRVNTSPFRQMRNQVNKNLQQGNSVPFYQNISFELLLDHLCL